MSVIETRTEPRAFQEYLVSPFSVAEVRASLRLPVLEPSTVSAVVEATFNEALAFEVEQWLEALTAEADHRFGRLEEHLGESTSSSVKVSVTCSCSPSLVVADPRKVDRLVTRTRDRV